MALSSSSVLSGSIEGKINTFDEPTQISEISDKNLRVILHKTYINNALYRVQGSDEEDRYESLIHANHFDGQECKNLIWNYPSVIEKLFKNERCNISIMNESMICEFPDVIIPIRITLSKVAETQFERMDKTICKQERKIVALKDENKQLNDEVGNMKSQIKTLETLLNEVSERLRKIEGFRPTVQSVKSSDLIVTAKKNKFGNYEHEGTGFVVDRDTKKVLGRQISDGTIAPLAAEDFEICLSMGLPFDLLKSRLEEDEKVNGKSPPNLSGKWILRSRKTYMMIITWSGSSFTIERCHLKHIFYPSNMGWTNGIFCWNILKHHDHTIDSQYAFDPKDPSTILEINGDVKNIFKKE